VTETDPEKLRTILTEVRGAGFAFVDSARVTLETLIHDFVPKLLVTARNIGDEIAGLLPLP
jgi:hypothetical protein